jgi:cyclic beta-1,2-glucan synthetase
MVAAWRRLTGRLASESQAPEFASAEAPLRAELFSADQMERHGKALAASHKLDGRGADQLLNRLTDNEDALRATCSLLRTAVKSGRRTTPAGEWLLDNAFLIDEQINTARRHFPKGYSRELPLLATGPSLGLPRVYDIALEAIAHGDGRVDPESLNRFVAAYQKIADLNLGELWAIPIMLRLALIENLRRVSARVAAGMIHRQRANGWADQMVEVAEKDPKSLILVIADMARSHPPMVSSFVAELVRRLQGHSSALALPLTWIEQRLSEAGLTIEQMVQSETQSQAANQVSISNSIGSLRFLGAMDWREFVENMSTVEQKLREDPDGIYGAMDFSTRDRYRHVIEKLARRCNLSESDVARKAIQLAYQGKTAQGKTTTEHANAHADPRTAHVGYYLIDHGRSQLEHLAGTPNSAAEILRKCRRLGSGRVLLLYLGAIALLTSLFAGLLLACVQSDGTPLWLLVPIGIAALLGASQLAVSLVNWLATLSATPHPLPRMDYSKGIPLAARSLVVVPTMITSVAVVDDLVEALEVRFLANRDANLHFSLLTDFRDATVEILPEDELLLRHAHERIDALNVKYAAPGKDSFFLFHRPRRWNEQERLWMGYERKRGKLADLNALLRHGSKQPFALIVGDSLVLSQIRYVITLDTDTQLPRDSACEFAAAMAHPLNRARFDQSGQRVVAGYGILQPRTAASLPSTNRSRYAQLSGSDAGIDPYTRAVSDVYQDLFREGSFIGKGIYDVEVFEQALKNRFPDNRILSHDLLEGCYARAGLLSDVQLYEDYPSRYAADVSRRHRWIRGDWQIAAWLLRRVPAHGGADARNPLSRLSQWKIFDNLRRSLVPAALTLLFLLGWFFVATPLYWSLSVIALTLLTPLAMSIAELVNKPKGVLPGQHLSAAFQNAGRQLTQVTLGLACLPYEAYFSLDAILRTWVRLTFTRKLLLEWNPSSESMRHPIVSGGAADLVDTWRAMWFAPFLAVVTGLALLNVRPMALVSAAPILLLWFAAPAIVWWISRPLVSHVAKLRPEQTAFLHKLSRRTWAFFDEFVTGQDNWLPPDNYQEHPVAVVAHRTSPTNMGMALLANLAAYDFGYLPAGKLLERTANALQTMQSLDRHQGHFYNWYDTVSLRPLPPLYISSVDSGNLCGHLLTLHPGLLALAGLPIFGARTFDGLGDTIRILVDEVAEKLSPELAQLRRDIDSAIDSRPATLTAAYIWLDRLTRLAAVVNSSMDAAGTGDAKRWAHALGRQCQDALDDLIFLAPWIHLSDAFSHTNELPYAGAIPTLHELSTLATEQITARDKQSTTTAEQQAWAAELAPLRDLARTRARERIDAIESLARQTGELAVVDYGLLYDNARHLMVVGYNVDQRRRDTGHYDLLASEARLTTFVAIAQGAVPQESWFALGRLLTASSGDPILLSWSGSMFEYLMPLLVMPGYENTLLDQTCRAAVKRQIAYGNQHGVPWGISECGYNTVDASLNYQYRAFGVPGLGLKRGLAEDLVIAPYASALALMVMPEAACHNLQRLAADGLQGRYGMYEAIDFTPSRLPRGQTSVVVRSFMAHHQGMSLLSLAFLLLDRPMQKRFESDPLFQATNLLLQERIPAATAFHLRPPEQADVQTTMSVPEMPMRVLRRADTPMPEVQLLSNGRYHVMVTNAGGGYSRWKDLAVTRWREDGTRDNWGTFCYIRDVATRQFWSTAHQPTTQTADSYEAIFSEGRAEFRRLDHDYETHTEIVVSPEDDIELRRMRITNRARTRRTIDVTSYAEVVLAPPAADALHAAFSNLFVQTEIITDRQAILCTRRPRSIDEQLPCMLHLMAVHGANAGAASYETDRMRFTGRTRSVESPRAMIETGALSGTAGSVLDPIVAIRYRITLDAEQSVTIDVVSGVGENRAAALNLVGKYRDRHLADRVFDLAWTHSWVNLRQINATESDAQLYGRLAGSVIHANPSLRADAGILARNRRGQSGLWGYAISGDLPIVLVQIGDLANIELVRQMVQAHAYWRLKGLAVDLVIWNEDHAGYRQLLQEQIMGLIAASTTANLTDRPGGIFVRAAEQISSEDRILFQTVARVIVSDTRGTLAEQMSRRASRETRDIALPLLIPTRSMSVPARRANAESDDEPVKGELQFFNSLGGFSADGREYVIATSPGQSTPAPWVNVIANEHFGTVISESGAAYTWSENAHEFRFTPWGGDPVSDASGEAIYLRDEESGHFWSPTSLPCGGKTPYVTRHGFGYSIFEHEEDGIASVLTVFVDGEAAVKFSILKIRNTSGRARRLSATGYVEWVLGDLRPKSAMHIVTEMEPSTGALCARNPYSVEFSDRIAFFDADEATMTATASYSGDRGEFIGRNGSLANPAAMTRIRLSNKVGAGLDPCAAIQIPFELGDGQEREIIFRLGAAGRRGTDAAGERVRRLRGSDAVHGSLEAVHAYWRRSLGAVQVDTPDPALNLLTNGWLLYQTLACRLWARSGYYQSGGAYGFRDQLQDTMALVHAEPRLVREHLLRCAARQFSEGDVQHWWHPPAGRGVRTRCSDDFLWLPQAVCRYVQITGDIGVLNESVHFLEGRPVNPEDDSYYDLPSRSEARATLYQHCVRAILKGLNFGEHGLPLMGSGDWNDGMNLVGIQGKGESVWLGFFLYDTLVRFGKLARAHGDHGDASFADLCQVEAGQLHRNLEQHAWDGGWYRRAWFDDGTPLGSAANAECRIDAIAQSWSVLSGAGDTGRSRMAMDALDKHLIRRDQSLMQLLDPPFDQSTLNPGYIKGYVPGVRENGGQYTHGAIWAAMAFAEQGDRRRAWELFDLINPLNHARSAEAIATYKVEPYVMAADVYAVSPHTGRGGWTWYTGSAGWMYRLAVESLLGLRVEAGRMRFYPCLPPHWPGFKMRYRYRETFYAIEVIAQGDAGIEMFVAVDGVPQQDSSIDLIDDRVEHMVVAKVRR